jgi:hypothetical protein
MDTDAMPSRRTLLTGLTCGICGLAGCSGLLGAESYDCLTIVIDGGTLDLSAELRYGIQGEGRNGSALSGTATDGWAHSVPEACRRRDSGEGPTVTTPISFTADFGSGTSVGPESPIVGKLELEQS